MKSCKQCGKLFYGKGGGFCSNSHRNKWNRFGYKYMDELEKYERVLRIYKQSLPKVQDELIILVMKLSAKTKTVMSKL